MLAKCYIKGLNYPLLRKYCSMFLSVMASLVTSLLKRIIKLQTCYEGFMAHKRSWSSMFSRRGEYFSFMFSIYPLQQEC